MSIDKRIAAQAGQVVAVAAGRNLSVLTHNVGIVEADLIDGVTSNTAGQFLQDETLTRMRAMLYVQHGMF